MTIPTDTESTGEKLFAAVTEIAAALEEAAATDPRRVFEILRLDNVAAFIEHMTGRPITADTFDVRGEEDDAA